MRRTPWLVFGLALSAPLFAGCKNGCDRYVDEIVTKGKQCSAQYPELAAAYKAPPNDLVCSESSAKIQACLADCVRGLSCLALRCTLEQDDLCAEDQASFDDYQQCASGCEAALCVAPDDC
jgi:hypothetical protein